MATSACPMNGGDGQYSYSKNSSFQRKGIDTAKEVIKKAIFDKLDVESLPSSSFGVTDLGCSVGPNTFTAVENILEAVTEKFRKQGLQVPEFQVLFSDQPLNDFNSLFQSLPQNRTYYAAGVPGSFHSRLFPKAHLHFAYSSYSLHFLSKVPELVLDMSSPAYNKGRIHYANSRHETVQAYLDHYVKDMDCFLKARAQEIVSGGLMAFSAPGRDTPHEQNFYTMSADLAGSCLMSMVKKGAIPEDKVDSFNLPLYFASLQEVEVIVKGNECFSIERMENLSREKPEPEVFASMYRAAMERTIKEHFGQETVDEFFDTLGKKYEESTSVFEPVSLIVVLKRI